MPDMGLPDERPNHPDVRFEKSDVKVGGIIAFGLVLGAVALFVHVLLGWVFDVFRTSERAQQSPMPPLVVRERPQLPRDLGKIPAPRLQTAEVLDMEQLRREEDRLLQSHGWVDAKAGVVRIPISEAMRMMADPKTAEAKGIRMKEKVRAEELRKNGGDN